MYYDAQGQDFVSAFVKTPLMSAGSSLTRLELCYNSIGDEGTIALAHAIVMKGAVPSQTDHPWLPGKVHVCKATTKRKKNQCPQHNNAPLLAMHQCSSDKLATRANSDICESDIHLRFLDLSYNNVGDEGAQALGYAIAGEHKSAGKPVIEILELEGNQVPRG